MRSSVLLPAALLICACTKTGDQASAKTTDSALPADSAAGAPASTKKSAGSKNAESPATASATASSASLSDAAPPTAQSKKPGPADTRCGLKGGPVLTDLGIGNLSIGRTATVVKRTCRVIRDIEELTGVGTLDRVLTVVIAGDVYRATVAGDLVNRITVRTPRVATRDGLRVGTPLSRIAALKGVKFAEGEDGLYMLPDSHCGLSFRFSIQSRWPTGRPWTMAELLRRHGGTPVDRIFVTRCIHPR